MAAPSYFKVSKATAPEGEGISPTERDTNDTSLKRTPLNPDDTVADEDDTTAAARKRRMPLSFLPAEIEQSLQHAITNARASSLSGASTSSSRHPFAASRVSQQPDFLQHVQSYRQQRAMSVPHNLKSKLHAAFATPDGAAERRGSMRAQQLALLASQARLASSGTTNVQAALRAERAVKAAVMTVVEDAQQSRQKQRASIALPSKVGDGTEESAGNAAKERAQDEKGASSLTDVEPTDMLDAAASDGTSAWSAALASPSSTTAFLQSAGEVARSWANGFYAFEKGWVGDALAEERHRSSAVESDAAPTELSRCVKSSSAPAAAPSHEHASDPTATSASPSTDASSTFTTPTDEQVPSSTVTPAPSQSALGKPLKSSPRTALLVAAQNRLSNAREGGRMSLSGASGAAAFPMPSSGTGALDQQGEASSATAGGKLLDVLSNFQSLIESRTEGCHGLERLAADARLMSAAPLPLLQQESSGNSNNATSFPAGDLALSPAARQTSMTPLIESPSSSS